MKTAYEMRISAWSSDVCSADLGAVRIWAGMGQADLGAGFQALAANVAQAARHCFALAVAMRRSEQRLALPLRARLDKRRNAGISEIRAAAERQAYFGCPRCGVWEDRKSTRLNSSH